MDTPSQLILNGTEYAILRLLGRGKGGYTWLAQRGGAQYAPPRALRLLPVWR